jgi:hypothetical protein
VNVDELIAGDIQAVVVENGRRAVVLDQRGQVLLGLNVQLFFALFVFEADFVEVVGAAAGAAVALEAALGLVVG